MEAVQDPVQVQPVDLKKPERLSRWLQFPRRVVFLGLAFGLFLGLITMMRTDLLARVRSTPYNLPAEEIWIRGQNSFRIIWIAFAIALLLSLVTMVIAYFVLRSEAKGGFFGSLLRALGRMWIFADISLPAFALGLFLIWIFAIRLELLPPAGMFSPNNDNPTDRLRHLILPVLAMAFMLSGISALSVTRRMISSTQKGSRRWAGGILRLLAAFFRQTGGILSGIIILEAVFSWPGIGHLLRGSIGIGAFETIFSIAIFMAEVILAGRLLSELFEWLAVLTDPETSAPPEPDRSLKKRRRGWLIFTLILLAVTLFFMVYGSMVSKEAINAIDPSGKLQDPSADHLLGTDAVGRDIWLRIARGTVNTFRVALAAAATVTPVAFGFGLLAGWLARKKRLWADLLADLILLPADAGLFLPVVVAGAIIILEGTAQTRGDQPVLAVVLAICLAILPRSIRFMAHAWADAPDGKIPKRVIGAVPSMLLGSLFAGFAALTALDFLGMGFNPTVVSLGRTLVDIMMYSFSTGSMGMVVAIMILWFCLWTFFLTAEALLEGWLDKRAISWLNS